MGRCAVADRNAVLLTAERRAKIADVGLARLMPNDYLTAQAAVGTFVWSVSICCSCSHAPGYSLPHLDINGSAWCNPTHPKQMKFITYLPFFDYLSHRFSLFQSK